MTEHGMEKVIWPRFGKDEKPEAVPGPNGGQLRMEDLPAPGTRRWVVRRKAEVVAAVEGGLLSLEEACTRYRLTREEFESWAQSLHRYGVKGLRTTRVQRYRGDSPSSGAADIKQAAE